MALCRFWFQYKLDPKLNDVVLNNISCKTASSWHFTLEVLCCCKGWLTFFFLTHQILNNVSFVWYMAFPWFSFSFFFCRQQMRSSSIVPLCNSTFVTFYQWWQTLSSLMMIGPHLQQPCIPGSQLTTSCLLLIVSCDLVRKPGSISGTVCTMAWFHLIYKNVTYVNLFTKM